MYCRNCGEELVGTPEICMKCGARPMAATAYCSACGVATNPMAVICVKCGASLEEKSKTKIVPGDVSTKSRLILVLLTLFLGEFGIHRFYVGKVGTGATMLILSIIGWATIIFIFGFIPLMVVGIWNLIDLIVAIAGSFKDNEGKSITNWNA